MSNGEPFFMDPAASAGLTSDDLQQQIGHFADGALNRQLLDAIPTPLLILNGRRQIVYANQSLLEMVAASEENQVFGSRPGDVLDCIFDRTSSGGCGTSEACKDCSAMLAVLSGLAGRNDERECCITRTRKGHQPEALDLRVRTTPITCGGELFTVLAVSDISHEKRRRVLERIFFHDILNVAGSIRGFAEYLLNQSPANREEIYALIQAAADQTIEEIETQRILSDAENNELRVVPEPFRLVDFLQTTVGLYHRHEVARDRALLVGPTIPDIILTSDQTLLRRLLGNTLKNALEAAAPGETVTVTCSVADDKVRFNVHNPGVIPHQVRLRIFQRSFSTKGEGRGLGTYSLRLLSDYLQCEVSFTSSAEDGTTFHILHPLTLALG
jgi:signal transduction histidine kinase